MATRLAWIILALALLGGATLVVGVATGAPTGTAAGLWLLLAVPLAKSAGCAALLVGRGRLLGALVLAALLAIYGAIVLDIDVL